MTIIRFLQIAFLSLLAVAIWAGDGSSAGLAAQQSMTYHTAAQQAVLLDYETGQVLYAKNADKKMAPSSMSKVMTIYLAFEALEDGRIQLDAHLPVSEKAWRKGGSKMFVEAGDRVRVEDLIRGVVVQSGNDASIVLAEGLAGSEDAFAAAMNQKASALGMENTHFVNASGWPDPEHYSTAADLGRLAVALIRDFPQFYAYFAETEFSHNNIRQMNRNPLLFRNMGADGIKTGHTEDGGYGLMASAIREGRRVVMVVNGLKDEKERAQESARMMEWGLRGFRNVAFYKPGDVAETADVIMGKDEKVPLVVDSAISATVPVKSQEDVQVRLIYEGPLEAPLKKGERAGRLEIVIPRLESISTPLLVGKNVERVGFFRETLTKIRLLAGGRKTDKKQADSEGNAAHTPLPAK